MKRRNATRSALFTSIISLLLCVSMLVGTTFAWFTDSVVSGNNVIAAGNLDVELYHSDNAETDEKVTNTTVLFDDVSSKLWEPGAMAWEKLTVKNNGSLSLKYILSVNIGKISVVDGKSLADVLKVAVLDEQPTRENVAAAATQDLASFVLENGKRLDPKGEESFYVAIYWAPSANDNDYNIAGEVLNAELGVTLYATQVEAEFDSFGNDYDADADEDVWVDGFDVHNENELQAAIDAGQTDIDVMEDIELTESLVIPASATSTFSLRSSGITINLNGKKLSGVGVDAEGNKVHTLVNNGTLTLVGGTVSSNGTNGGSAIYNAAGAALTLEDVTVVGAPQDANNTGAWPSYAINSYGNLTIKSADITSAHGAIAVYGDTVIYDANVTVNGRGGSSHVFYIGGEGTDLIVNGGTYTHKGNTDGSLAYIMTGTTMTVNGGTFTASNGGYGLATYTGSLTVNGGTFANAFLDWGGPISIAGGTFASKPDGKYIAAGYKANDNGDGTYTVKFTQESFDNLIDNAGENATIEIPAGEYTFPASDLKAGQTLNCAPGTVFEGKSGMNINGATVIGATFSNSDGVAGAGTINGTFKDCVFEGSEALRWCYAGETVVFENCEFKTDFRGVHFDGMDHDVIFRNCKINGFNAFGGTATVTFKGCTFGCDESRYNGLNMHCNTVLTDCKFEFITGKTNFIDFEEAGHTLTITNCTATLDGETANVLDFVGGTYKDQTTIIARETTTTEDGLVLSADCVTGTVALYDTADYTGDTLEVPAGVQAIGNYAFAYNNTIETVVLPSTVTDLGRGFDSSTVKMVVLNEGLETISSRAFRSTTALEEVVISSTVKEIADNAFQKSGIKEIVIPANVKTIGEAAFGSSKIEKVTIEDNTSIQGYAFRGCTNLREVHLLGDDVTFIKSTLNGRNSMWFCNGESNNPNASNITFYVVNKTVAARVKEAMGAEANNTPVYVNGFLYEG